LLLSTAFEEKRMPKAGLVTRDHVLDAMTYVGSDPTQWPYRSRPTIYFVIDPRNGAPLPPKLVLTTAAQMASSDRRYPMFSGGQHTNKRLQELGFSVVEKTAAEASASSTALPV
jgi:hypothetical protein